MCILYCCTYFSCMISRIAAFNTKNFCQYFQIFVVLKLNRSVVCSLKLTLEPINIIIYSYRDINMLLIIIDIFAVIITVIILHDKSNLTGPVSQVTVNSVYLLVFLSSCISNLISGFGEIS